MSIERLLTLLEGQLGLRTQHIRALVRHNGTIGWANERAVADLIGAYLPKRCAVARGFVLAPDGRQSRQGDVLIYDAHDHAPFRCSRSRGWWCSPPRPWWR